MIERYYWIETYGCQMNKAESNALMQEMAEAGWKSASSPREAELVILNTCSVRTTAESRIRGRIGFYKALKKTHPHTLVLMGCMAERLKEGLKEDEPTIDLVVGTFQKGEFLSILKDPSREIVSVDNIPTPTHYEFASAHSLSGEFKALVPIMHGCNNFCTYCIVPYVRGREVSRAPQDIFAELEIARVKGVQEVTLLGQNVNSYSFEGSDGVVDFAQLLEEITERFPSLEWIRFLTSHPKDLSPRVIQCLAKHPRLCKHLHLPVQHGSNAILTQMNRRYSRESYLDLVRSLRSQIPELSLTTDILIGFPGETEQDFLDTVELLKTLRFDDAFTYYYNPREGTRAFELTDDVPHSLKLERLNKIIEVQKRIGQEIKRGRIGRKVKVLVEEVSKMKSTDLLARTERDEMVVLPGPKDWIGRFLHVELLSIKGNTFVARTLP